jgi:hypothetical protein
MFQYKSGKASPMISKQFKHASLANEFYNDKMTIEQKQHLTIFLINIDKNKNRTYKMINHNMLVGLMGSGNKAKVYRNTKKVVK